MMTLVRKFQSWPCLGGGRKTQKKGRSATPNPNGSQESVSGGSQVEVSDSRYRDREQRFSRNPLHMNPLTPTPTVIEAQSIDGNRGSVLSAGSEDTDLGVRIEDRPLSTQMTALSPPPDSAQQATIPSSAVDANLTVPTPNRHRRGQPSIDTIASDSSFGCMWARETENRNFTRVDASSHSSPVPPSSFAPHLTPPRPRGHQRNTTATTIASIATILTEASSKEEKEDKGKGISTGEQVEAESSTAHQRHPSISSQTSMTSQELTNFRDENQRNILGTFFPATNEALSNIQGNGEGSSTGHLAPPPPTTSRWSATTASDGQLDEVASVITLSSISTTGRASATTLGENGERPWSAFFSNDGRQSILSAETTDDRNSVERTTATTSAVNSVQLQSSTAQTTVENSPTTEGLSPLPQPTQSTQPTHGRSNSDSSLLALYTNRSSSPS